MKSKIKQEGFTVIELLVVISIIGLLSATILVSLNSARQKSRDARRLADVRQILNALELYYADNFAYPDQLFAGGDPILTSVGVTRAEIGESPEVAGASLDVDREGEVRSATSTLLASVGPPPSPTMWQYYLGVWPAAPTPPDGGCGSGPATDITISTNQYTYWGRSINDTASILDDPQSYQITFCLGAGVGGLPGGQMKATPKGIVPN